MSGACWRKLGQMFTFPSIYTLPNSLMLNCNFAILWKDSLKNNISNKSAFMPSF